MGGGNHTLTKGSKEQNNSPPADTNLSEALSASSTTSLNRAKKRKDNVSLVETEVRRSCRLKQLNKGYKNSVCKDKDCLACHSVPPLIPPKVVKSLNTSFCKVSNKDTTKELLNKKHKKTKSGGTSMEGARNARDQNKKWI